MQSIVKLSVNICLVFFMLSVVMLNVVILSFIMLNVVALEMIVRVKHSRRLLQKFLYKGCRKRRGSDLTRQ
jgi:hypothetical protein